MQRLSIVQDYILHALLHHRIVTPMGAGDTVWAGVDFSRDVSVLSNEHDFVQDLYKAIEDWLLVTIRNGESVPVIDGIDLNSEEGQALVAWHESHDRAIDPEQQWFWTPEWQAGERAVSHELETGETAKYTSTDAFLTALESEQPSP